MPLAMFLRSRRRTRVASLPIDYLSCDLKRRRNASGYTRAAPLAGPPAKFETCGYFFLPAIALAGPLRVRALV